MHPWVNYEQILQKCFVGRLVAIDPNMDTEALFFGNKRDSLSHLDDLATQEEQEQFTVEATKLENLKSLKSNNSIHKTHTPTEEDTSLLARVASPTSNIDEGSVSAEVEESSEKLPKQKEQLQLPRFDWIQKLDYITVIFYTKAFSNSLVEILPPTESKMIAIILTYEQTEFRNELEFNQAVEWPGSINVIVETGKITVTFKKIDSLVWENYGRLRQSSRAKEAVKNVKSSFIVKNKVKVTHNTYLIMLDRSDGGKIVTPVGNHIRVFGTIEG